MPSADLGGDGVGFLATIDPKKAPSTRLASSPTFIMLVLGTPFTVQCVSIITKEIYLYT